MEFFTKKDALSLISDKAAKQLPDDLLLYKEGSEIFRASWSADGKQYRLLDTQGEPTLEINGVRMHLSEIKPSVDMLKRAKLARVGKESNVLDVCMGLGYSALAAVKLGAKQVTTIEIDANVVKLANMVNEIEKNDKITLVNDDAFFAIKSLGDEEFDAILFDPPRFTFAGELYSLEFYKELHRVLKHKSSMFHYCGNPNKPTAFLKGVKQRLTQAGFAKLKANEDAQGFYAYKV